MMKIYFLLIIFGLCLCLMNGAAKKRPSKDVGKNKRKPATKNTRIEEDDDEEDDYVEVKKTSPTKTNTRNVNAVEVEENKPAEESSNNNNSNVQPEEIKENIISQEIIKNENSEPVYRENNATPDESLPEIIHTESQPSEGVKIETAHLDDLITLNNIKEDEANIISNNAPEHHVEEIIKPDDNQVGNNKENTQDQSPDQISNTQNITDISNNHSEQNTQQAHHATTDEGVKATSNEHLTNLINLFHKYFNKEGKLFEYYCLFLVYLGKIHKNIQAYVPYPYDLLIFVLFGYYLSKLLGFFRTKKVKTPILSEDTDTYVNNIEKKINELSKILSKSINQTQNQPQTHGTVNNQDRTAMPKRNNPLFENEKSKLLKKLDEAGKFISAIKGDLDKDLTSCNKTLDDICATQINILEKLQ